MAFLSFGSPPVTRAIAYNRGLWLGVALWAVFTGAVLWFGGWWTWQNHLFADHGRSTAATVIRLYTTISHGRHGSSTTYHVVYGYRVGDLLVNTQTSVHRATYLQMTAGGILPIKYLPEKPDDSRLDNTAEDADKSRAQWAGLGVGLVSLVVGTYATAHTHRRNRLQRRLTATGFSTQGTITDIASERVGKRMQPYLRFEFNDHRGQRIEGRTGPLTDRQAEPWTVGRLITVHYDGADSRVFTVNLHETLV